MLVSLIAALDEAGGIGKNGQVPWRLRTDLRRFKQLTMGHILIMGRKTYESIGRALPGRTNIIVTRNVGYPLVHFTVMDCCIVVHSLDEAFAYAAEQGETEAFVIGGGEIYRQALGRADRLYLTRVHTDAGCEVFFPEFEVGEWRELERVEHPADEANEFATTFSIFARVDHRDFDQPIVREPGA